MTSPCFYSSRFAPQKDLLQPGAAVILGLDIFRGRSMHPGVENRLLEQERIDKEGRRALKQAPTFTKTCDVVNVVCEYLATKDHLAVSRVNKQWNRFLNGRLDNGVASGALAEKRDQLRQWVHENAFGANQWEKYYGAVDKLSLPLELYDILNGPCPINPGEIVKQTHMLFLLPNTVDGQPLTFNSLEALVKAPKEGSGGHATQYQYIDSYVLPQFGDASKGSCWVLMSKDVIPGSRKKSFKQQRRLIPRASSDCTYEVPGTLEATVGILTDFARTGKRLYSVTPCTYTRCSETPSRYSPVVGCFDAFGLTVYAYYNVTENIGLAILRKFSGS